MNVLMLFRGCGVDHEFLETIERKVGSTEMLLAADGDEAEIDAAEEAAETSHNAVGSVRRPPTQRHSHG
jgi:hypothetical protein